MLVTKDCMNAKWEFRMVKLEESMKSHCEENNAHFMRIEKSQETLAVKIDKFIDVTNTKADRAEVVELAHSKANKDDLKELRGWVVGGILISILLMVVSIILRK